jgi:phosphoglycerate dehydrogenase-like enzyme
LLLVGYGHIGREFAQRVRPFGVHILTVSRSAQRDELVDEALPLSALHQALGRADAIVVVIAHTPETTGLLSDAEFDACRKGALLVNVARGAVVDTQALRRALADGRIGGAALDVTDPEPLPPDHPLWDGPNILISPHFAASGSPRSLQRLGEGVAQNARRLLAGETLLHIVSSDSSATTD